MTPEDRATFAAAPQSINNDGLIDLSARYTPKEISIHANAGRAKPVISASNVSERLYASINRIAKRDGRIRTEVKGELDAARERASARHSGSIIGAGVLDPATDDDVEMEDAGEEAATGHGLTAGDLLRAIEGPKPLTDVEIEALRRFDETRDYETDNVEDGVESPEPLVYVAPAINQTGSTAPAIAQETVDQSNTGTVAGLEAEAQRLTVDDAEPLGHTTTGPRVDQGSSATLSPPTTQADVSNSDSTSAAAGVAALRQRLRALEVNGVFEADEVHVMDDEIVKLSVRHSVTEIVELLNAGTETVPTAKHDVKVVQEIVDAAVIVVAARKGQALEAFRAEFEEMRVANGVVAERSARE
ncbi:hypothetical protein B0A54_03145 [Friedmanniomyces endolithicus]|uniref:Uncharacterized protein n=1 Tax=Friedmanniomyces endolithicus TaxID=329885 RepID=A0A4U0VA81_9PEZI|nr:hypothetical protein LTS09_009759 [Friedmanniomyces endolithicus]TKA44855.1 hypothetical protein B0A54_03145 [Friedmanniomyces endolithicus]